jgi:hypothetical protein
VEESNRSQTHKYLGIGVQEKQESMSQVSADIVDSAYSLVFLGDPNGLWSYRGLTFEFDGRLPVVLQLTFRLGLLGHWDKNRVCFPAPMRTCTCRVRCEDSRGDSLSVSDRLLIAKNTPALSSSSMSSRQAGGELYFYSTLRSSPAANHPNLSGSSR